jgi:hypothetical protein
MTEAIRKQAEQWIDAQSRTPDKVSANAARTAQSCQPSAASSPRS